MRALAAQYAMRNVTISKWLRQHSPSSLKASKGMGGKPLMLCHLSPKNQSTQTLIPSPQYNNGPH
jgi:hypothetical protein